jgi:hypothetical protein
MTTTTHHRGRQSAGPAAYLGWSHDNNRLEMMDLSGYLDSLQRSFDSVQQAYSSMATAMPTASPWWTPTPTGGHPPTRGHGRRHDHGSRTGHEHDHDGDCACDGDCGCGGGCGCDCGHQGHHGHRGRDRDCGCERTTCRCDCCVVDADIIVYGHCGEVRVVPIEIDNDTRKPREDVSLDISDVRTAGGRLLPWQTATTVQGPLTLDACSTTRFEILVRVDCRSSDRDGEANPPADKGKGAKTDREAEGRAFVETVDVDDCVVGYFTVSLGGCLTRPIVVAVAALPYACDSYRTGCACASCC